MGAPVKVCMNQEERRTAHWSNSSGRAWRPVPTPGPPAGMAEELSGTVRRTPCFVGADQGFGRADRALAQRGLRLSHAWVLEQFRGAGLRVAHEHGGPGGMRTVVLKRAS